MTGLTDLVRTKNTFSRDDDRRGIRYGSNAKSDVAQPTPKFVTGLVFLSHGMSSEVGAEG